MTQKAHVHGMFFLMLLVAPCTATQASIVYTATLSGAAESPPVASPGTGSATVTYDADLHTLHVAASFSDLIGTTTAAHIHCCTTSPFTGTAGVATPTPSFPGFPAGVTAGTYDQLFDLTLASSFNSAFVTANGGTAAGAETALAAGLAGGNAYFNIHTSTFGGGEIRGFLAPVPLPAAGWLFGVGMIGLMGAAQRRRGMLRQFMNSPG